MEPSVDRRVACGEDRGTVRYIGPVGDFNGVWLGVEWDKDGRGRHNGTLDDVTYFVAKSPKSGSFVKPAKVSFGCTLLTAVTERYGLECATEDHFLEQHIGKKEIEFVGMEKVGKKQRQFERLRNVVLDGMTVSSCDGDSDLVAATLKSCTDLDLTRNLLWNWTDVMRFVQILPKLRFMNLSKNFFRPFAVHDRDFLSNKNKKKLRFLALNDCGLNWSDVLGVFETFTELEELHLCKNGFSSITRLPSKQLDALKVLDLQSNNLSNWEDILMLASVARNLNTLNISGNEIISITDETNSIFERFSCLKTLYLLQNKIDNWESVNVLNKLESLDHLLLNGNPIINHKDHQMVRQMVIARVACLKILDRLMIAAAERRGAELDYLKHQGAEFLSVFQENMPADLVYNDRQIDFIKRHSRYLELVTKYGPPDEFELAKPKFGGVLLNRLITVTVVYEEKSIIKKLPVNMTVQKLKALVGRVWKIDARHIGCHYENPSRPGVTVEMVNDLRELMFYDVENNAIIYVKTDIY